MAESKNNIVTYGLSGLVGDMLVFTSRAGKTIVSRKPEKSSAPPTAQQALVRQRFKDAINYAKAAIAVPATKAMYEAMAKPGQSAFNLAMADVWKGPEIQDIVTTNYTGLLNSKVVVKVVDRFKVESVMVVITSPAGVLIEQGPAVQQQGGIDWLYTATAVNSTMDGTMVAVTAKDSPGNETFLDKTIQQ